MSACRRHYPGRIDETDSLITAPSTAAFPRLQLGRLLHYQFRGLLSVHSRYNLQTRQVALCDPLHRRLRRLCCLHRRSDCYRVERSSSRAGLSPAVDQRLSRRTVIANCLVPEFGRLALRDLSPLTLQRYFSGLAASPLAHESKDKIRDVLSSILGSAVQYGLLVKNPVEGIRIPADKRGKRKTKPHVTPEQFEQLVSLISEPYASMVYVAVW